ncbi:MAG: DMT family transporter [Pseudohongiellaceae bacterium]
MLAHKIKVPIYTVLALSAFAGNSVLCRLALGTEDIDPASFTFVRLLSGSFTLIVLLLIRTRGDLANGISRGNWPAATMLFIYAIFFAAAYSSLDTGTGAVVLFGAVQITLIIKSLRDGEALSGFEWLGLAVAFIGFALLLLPGTTAPSSVGIVLMIVAGMGWGLYTAAGQASKDALADTSFNFLRATPLATLVLIFWPLENTWSTNGIFLACASGALASGIGYGIWYAVLPSLKSVQAAVLQLTVPFLAAGGGIIFSDEIITARLLTTGTIVCAGIGLVVLGKAKKSGSTRENGADR